MLTLACASSHHVPRAADAHARAVLHLRIGLMRVCKRDGALEERARFLPVAEPAYDIPADQVETLRDWRMPAKPSVWEVT